MPFAIEQQQFGLKKEAVRLTGEAAPDRWLAFDAESGLDYVLKHIEDEGLRNIKGPFPPEAGVKELAGKLLAPVRAQNIGEVLQMLLGDPVSSTQQGATIAYKHQFNNPSVIQLPTYSFFHERSLDVFRSVGVGVKKVTFEMPVDSAMRYEAELMGITEADGSTIGVPVYSESAQLTMQNCTFKIAGVANQNVKNWTLGIDNGMFMKRALNQSQDAQDSVLQGKMAIDGGFTIFFEDVVERDKFIANTKVAIQILVEGAIIASTFKYTVDINLYGVRYTAFPFGEEDGLLAAAVTFNSFYSSADAKQLQIDVTNTQVSY